MEIVQMSHVLKQLTVRDLKEKKNVSMINNVNVKTVSFFSAVFLQYD